MLAAHGCQMNPTSAELLGRGPFGLSPLTSLTTRNLAVTGDSPINPQVARESAP